MIVEFKESQLNYPYGELGFTGVVKDYDTDEILYSTSTQVPAGLGTPIRGAISVWKSITDKYGHDLEVYDRSGITKEFLEEGLNPQRHYVVVKKRGDKVYIEIHYGFKNLPIYKDVYTVAWNMPLERIASIIKSYSNKFKNCSFDLSEASEISSFF